MIVKEASGDKDSKGVDGMSLRNNNKGSHGMSIKCSHHDDGKVIVKVSPKELNECPKCYSHVTYPKLKTEGRSD